MSRPAAHFVGLTVEKLWSIEEELGEPDDVQEYFDDLLKILAQWRNNLMADEWRLRHYGRDYEKALKVVSDVWLQWNFRHKGNEVWLPESFDLPGVPQKGADR
ncbi:hypothetical protein SAMN06297387_1128 [Streptomyces zhaozhouensis]|uniref:Uncharacterized protein n=2 Tax=Streptomyces zhaozhouensis TaxID=1300267 RepID=A0A286DYC1_9ACTN|nr:hypothetical protein SAMN06297387_1128 [Streptomyces zhaozhouensis]